MKDLIANAASEIGILHFLSNFESSNGIFTRFTMTSNTQAWYSPVSPMETILICLVILQILVLRYLGILPIDFSALFQNGQLIAKRKKRGTIAQALRDDENLDEMFKILRKIDRYDCFLRTLCELEYTEESNLDKYVPESTKTALSVLRKSGLRREKFSENERNHNETIIDERKVISVFEDAILFGYKAKKSSSNFNPRQDDDIDMNLIVDFNDFRAIGRNLSSFTPCELKYTICPLTTSEIFYYVDSIGLSHY